MGNWSLGSVHEFVREVIEDVPSYISGVRLLEIADQKRQFVADYTGNTIGSNSIGIKYQGVVSDFTCADVLRLMEMRGADVSSFKLGDLSVSKGTSSSAMSASDKFKEEGWKKLREFGRNINFYKALG